METLNFVHSTKKIIFLMKVVCASKVSLKIVYISASRTAEKVDVVAS